MNSALQLNGPDQWEDSVAEAYEQKWRDCRYKNDSYEWHQLAMALYQSAKQINCDTCRFLSDIAFQHEISVIQERQADTPRTVTRGAVNSSTGCTS